MDHIRSLIATARRRLLMEAWLSSTLQASVFVALVLLVLVLERRVTGGSRWLGLPSGWEGVATWVAVCLALLAAAAGYGAWRARRAVRNETSAALELDARLATGERFTTALELEGDADPFAQAAVADAVRYATTPAVAQAVHDRFSIKPPERWWLTPSILTVALVMWLVLPQLSLFGIDETKAAQADPDVPKLPSPEEQRLDALVKAIQESPELSEKLKAELENAKQTLDANADERKPEEQARDALRRVAELQARLEEMKGSKESQATKALQDALSQLEMPKEQNAAADLANALKRGDFAEAKKAVEELQKAAKDGNLSKEQRDALADALDKTAKQLEQLSKDPQKLADALKSAGMDPALAQNPAALEQALKQSQQLNQTQKESLQKLADAIQKSQQQLGQMSQQMNKMASQCKNPGQNPGENGGQQGQSGSPQSQQAGQEQSQGMSQMLSQAESDQMMAQACQNAASQCNGGSAMSESEADSALRSSCRGDGQGSSNKLKDNNEGGRGVAGGGNRDIKQTAYGLKNQHQKGARGEGDIIARQLVEGESPVGESLVKLEQVASKIATSAERGSEDDPIPPHLQEVSKAYFGKMNKVMQERGVKPAPATTAPASPADKPAPAKPAPPKPAQGQ